MYELEKVGKNSYYIESPAKIGVYVKDNLDAYLIDSGNDKDAGRKIKKILDENGWNLKGILVTHSNADHIGGCNYLQKQLGCQIFTRGIERSITENPLIEPSFLYGGYPFKELRNKFLMAQPSDCTGFDDELFPKEIDIIDLPGHFFDMVGFRIPDGTVFIGDCLFSKEILDKYKIPFIYDVDKFIETLNYIKTLDANVFIPSHAKPQQEIEPLAEYNIKKVEEIRDLIKKICANETSFEGILKDVFTIYDLKMDYNQYVLVGSTLKSFLSWMKDRGEIDTNIKENTMYWYVKNGERNE